jgi:hypothetical protein
LVRARRRRRFDDLQAMSKIAILRKALLELLAEHERDGAIPTNGRFLYYELIARGVISKERQGARRPDQDANESANPWETRAFRSDIAFMTSSTVTPSGYPDSPRCPLVLDLIPSSRSRCSVIGW